MTDVFPVVAGTDGSAKASAAVDEAAAFAQMRGLPLTLLYGFAPLYGYAGFDPTPPAEILDACQKVVDGEVERVRSAHPELVVKSAVPIADPAIALVDASADASAVFVGARGLGAVRRLLLGSVSTKVATYAKCPTFVVRGPVGDPHGPVVIGISPEYGSPEALHFGFAYARERGLAVRVIQAQQHVAANFDYLPPDVMREVIEDQIHAAEERAQHAFEAVAVDYPDVHASLDILPGHAVDALLDAAKEASLVVVGKHGAHNVAARLLGSVTLGVLGSAPFVAVIPSQ
ncbi:MAG: universal stress protein [Ancrocorticia sp.]|jgi:nucleotide-binding universal stress UspA family protein|nr:universal stress protein [Ancrocorticia sp.]MCI2002866.1 universal stress protein [Ancrocorticia sp.]